MAGVIDRTACNGGIVPFNRAVGTAFNKTHAANAWEAHDLVHIKHHRPLEHAVVRAVDHQAVLGRVNIPPALVMPLKMQAARCDDAEQGLQRAEAHTGRANAGQTWAFASLQVFFELAG